MPDDPLIRHDFGAITERKKEAPSQTEYEHKLAALVDERYLEGEENRTYLILNWLMNKAYVRGDQWIEKEAETLSGDTRLRRPDVPSWQRHITVNWLFNSERVYVARLCAQTLSPQVIPQTSDEGDRSKARACEALLKAHTSGKRLESEKIEVATETFECGTGWVKVIWDSNAGDPLPDPDPDDPLFKGVKIPTGQREGDIYVRSVSPLDFLPDPGARRPEDMRWAIQDYLLHQDEVYEKWGVIVPAERGMTTHRVLDEQTEIAPEHHDAKDMVRVLEYWAKPSEDYPEGVHAIVAGGWTLWHEKKLVRNRIPVVRFVNFPDPESMYGITPLDFGRTMQRELNITVSSIVQGRESNLYGKWFNPVGNGVRFITRAPGEFIPFDPSVGPPIYVPQEPVSPQAYEMINQFKNLGVYVLGDNDAAMGESSSSTSGRAIAFAAEESSTKLAPTMTHWRESWKEVFQLMLETWKDYAPSPVRYAVVGGNAAADMHELDASEIEYYDIEVTVDNALPQNKQARRELVLMLMQAGVVDQNEARRMMEFGDVEDAFGAQNRDRQRARAENRMLVEGPVPVRMHENHVLHMEVLIQYMKDDEWYALPQVVQANYEQHLQEHMAVLQGASGGQSATAPQQPQGGEQTSAPSALPPGESPAPQGANTQELGPSEQGAVEVIRGETI